MEGAVAGAAGPGVLASPADGTPVDGTLADGSSAGDAWVGPPAALAEGRVGWALVRLALPSMTEGLLFFLVMLVDTLVVGWLRSDAMMAGMMLSGVLWFFLQSLFIAQATAATALVARAWGAGDHAAAGRVGAQAVGLALVLAVGLFLALRPVAPLYFQLMGAEPEAARQGQTYLAIFLLMMPTVLPLVVVNGVLRGSGDATTPLILTALYNLINVVGDLTLAFGLDPIPALGFPGVQALGLAGVAWSSAVGGWVSGGLGLALLLRRGGGIPIPLAGLIRWRRDLLRRLFAVAWPALGELVMQRVGFILFFRMLSELGTLTLAAHAIALRLEALSFLPGFGLSVACAALVGQCLGARRPDLAEQVTKRALWLGMAFMGGIGLLFLIAGPTMAMLFGATPAVVALAGRALRVGAAEQPFLAAYFAFTGALRGAGDTRTPLIVSLIGTLPLRLALVYVIAFQLEWGLEGVWAACAIDWAGRAAMLAWFFKRGRWKQVQV